MPPDDPEKGGASRPGMPAVGPTTAPQRELERVARGKLLYRLKRIEEGEERTPEKPTPRNPEEGSGGGIIV